MPQINLQHLHMFMERFPLLAPTLDKLNVAQIPFAISGSGCLFLFGNERLPDDVDIFLPDDRHNEADKLFGIESYTYTSESEHVRNSNPENNHSIQLTSHLILTIKGRPYTLNVTKDILQHCTRTDYDGHILSVFPPEDVLLVKALLQRGTDVGKHDLEDIANFLNTHPTINRNYLEQRVKTLAAEERVGDIFETL